MLEAWGRFTYRRRWPMLAVAMAVLMIAAVWGTGVFGALKSSGGFDTPGSESAKAAEIAERELGRDSADVVILYKSTTGRTVDDKAYERSATSALAALPKDKVTGAASYYSTKSPQLVSQDRTSTYAALQLAGSDEQAREESYDAIKDQLHRADGLSAQVGGQVATEAAINERVSEDIAKAESISTPVLLVLLTLIFGGLAAASLPLAIGGWRSWGPSPRSAC